MKLDRQVLIVAVVAFCLGAMAAFVTLALSNRARPAPIAIVPPEPTATPAPTATPGPLVVDVDGAVAAPAVYALAPGSRVADAIEAAGGFTAVADAAVLNLAQPLQDGMQVFVPEEGSALGVTAVESLALPEPATRGGQSTLDLGSGGQLVDLNLATLEELDGLPGIGPSTAQKIIDYREENGPFTAVEELLNVSGIGEAKFEQVKAFIVVR